MKRVFLILAASAVIFGGSLFAPDKAEANRRGYYRGPAVAYHYGYGVPHVRFYGYPNRYYSYPNRYYSGYYGYYPRRYYYGYPYQYNYGPSFYLSSPRGGIYYRY